LVQNPVNPQAVTPRVTLGVRLPAAAGFPLMG